MQDDATKVVMEILHSESASDSNRIRATKIVFDQTLKLRSLLEIEERLAKIEELYNEFIED